MKTKLLILAALFMGSSAFAERGYRSLEGFYQSECGTQVYEVIQEYDGILVKNVKSDNWNFYKKNRRKRGIFKSKRGSKIYVTRNGHLKWDRKRKSNLVLHPLRNHRHIGHWNRYDRHDHHHRYHNTRYRSHYDRYNNRSKSCRR